MNQRKYPGTFKIYKKSGAAQFTILQPRRDDNGRVEKDGAILLEAVKSAGESYPWQTDKISFAIGISDICNFFINPDSPPKLIHSMPGSTSVKTLEFSQGEGKWAGTYMLKLSESDKSKNTFKNASIPLSSGEHFVICRLLSSSLDKLIGWQ